MYDEIEDDLDHYIIQHTTFEDYNLVAFLENEEDERFWKYIFTKSIPDKRIAFNFYSKNGDQGKTAILKYKNYILNKEAKALICLDSDFDYISNCNNINENPFILQTYTYSVENYSCCAKSLTELCETLLIKTDNFNFEIFLSNYSNIVFELFVLDVMLKEEQTDITNLYSGTINSILMRNNGEQFLIDLKTKVDVQILEIKENFSIDSADFEILKNKILQDDLINHNFIHLYLNGHLIFNLTKNILSNLCDTDCRSKIELLKESFQNQELSRKIKELNNKRPCLRTALNLNFSNCHIKTYCPSFSKIIDEVKEIYA